MTDDRPYDMATIQEGLLPWPVAESIEMLEEAQRLIQKPKDDWDHTPRRIGIEASPGQVEVYRFNSLEPMNQILNILTRRYSGTTFMAHAWRWTEIGYFMRKYDKRLRRDGWVRACDEPGKKEIHDALMHALCESPYRAHRGRGENRQRTFKYDDVVARAREIAGPGPLQ